jgi:hypothetical protein
MDDIYTNVLALEVLCLGIIEGAKAYFEKSKFKKDESIKDRVEFWVENYVRPAIENAIEYIFEEED